MLFCAFECWNRAAHIFISCSLMRRCLSVRAHDFCRVTPSKEMQAALKVINDSLSKNQHLATTLKNANKIVQKEWFRISSTETASPFDVEDYLDCFEEHSPNLLKYIVNLADANVITHIRLLFASSHGVCCRFSCLFFFFRRPIWLRYS